MTAYVFRRLAWTGVLVLVITWVTYVIFFVLPSDAQSTNRRTALANGDIRYAIPVHGAIYQEYGQFLWALVHGSLGESSQNRESVTSILARTAPVTASLVVGGVLLWMLIAIPVGVVSALRPRSPVDRSATVFVLLGISMHPVWIGLVLSYLLGYRLGLLPSQGYCDFFHPPPGAQCGGGFQWAYHMVLPWLTFAFLFAALYMRMVRANVTETLDLDYVRTARAKGASEWRVMRSHVLRTALLPVVTMLGMDIGLALGGSVFVESVYGLPGLGRTVVAALPQRDLPTIMGVLLVATLAIALLNLVVDVLYAALDPRVRIGRSVEASD
jgi:peptide/nickel transport system permease protein